MGATAQNMRLDVRLPARNKQLIEQAACVLGQTVSGFTVSTLVREAEDVIQRFGSLHLSDDDRDIFMSALDNPPKPNGRLKQAAKKHSKEVA